MYAVITTGGKQYRVSPGDLLKVEKLAKEKGEKVEFKEVLLLKDDKGIKVGTPYLPNAKVVCTVLTEAKDKKIIVFKKKRRKGYRRKRGHRQWYSLLKVEKITAEAAKPRRKKKEEEEKKEA
ncbi:MAG: 50S ribosomal protein L21 [Acidobacteria bacterium]|nr:50S ribosomal protein L21 [Acidobacteriota bacterium]